MADAAGPPETAARHSNPREGTFMAIIEQIGAFYDEMTAPQMVRFLLRLSGFNRREAERRAREALARVELEEGLGEHVLGILSRARHLRLLRF